jgi:hypothetical protein
LWRWKRTERLHFPLAALVNNIEHNDLNAIDAWMRSRVVDRTVTVGTEEETAASKRGRTLALRTALLRTIPTTTKFNISIF